MAKTVYPVDNITGGTTSDLDGQDGANLNDGDFALVLNETGTWIYRLDGDNALPESPPDIVAPTVNAGDKRWVLRYSSVERGFIEQLNIAVNSSDTSHDVDIPPGFASLDNKNNSYYRPFRLSSTITKQIDSNWVEGSNNGGFPSGLTLSANTTYYVFLIGKTNGNIDGGFDSATDASNLLADASTYDWYRQLGYVETDGSANISIVVPQAPAYGVGKNPGELVQYEVDTSGNTVVDHPTMPKVNGDPIIEPGTKMLFKQSSAPAGWTFVAEDNDRALINTSTEADGGSTGGSWQLPDVNGHTLSLSEIPNVSGYFDIRVESSGAGSLVNSTTGPFSDEGPGVTTNTYAGDGNNANNQRIGFDNGGGDGSHIHSQVDTWRPSYAKVITCEKQ